MHHLALLIIALGLIACVAPAAGPVTYHIDTTQTVGKIA